MLYSPEKLERGNDKLRELIGGKGNNIQNLIDYGFTIPTTLFLTTQCYDEFVDHNNLREKIALELHRKNFNEMRWEEIWDIALKIQSLFLQGYFPDLLAKKIEKQVAKQFHDKSLVVRSSSPSEDDSSNSFAGLHDSSVNIRNGPELLKQIKKVWASLWSDRAILYRQELGLRVLSSSMAVVIQEFIDGECSGVVFSRNPLEHSQLVIEAVYGLNQGLVDGTIEPDRWILERKDLSLSEHQNPDRDYSISRSHRSGVKKEILSNNRKNIAPLDAIQVQNIARLSLQLEEKFCSPQDTEWTIVNNKVVVLQSRPITATNQTSTSDKRSWYISLTRSYDNLLQLWKTIDEIHLPEMDKESESFSKVVFEKLSDVELVAELKNREAANIKWTQIYWDEFIPFAHGARLLGELYNELMQPEDPFEFVLLLSGQRMLSTERNKLLYKCAELIKKRPSLRLLVEKGKLAEVDDTDFKEKVDLLIHHFAMTDHRKNREKSEDKLISAIILKYAELVKIPRNQASENIAELEAEFLNKAKNTLSCDPLALLKMARASYRIRDDDNIHIGRINQELERAVAEGMKRLSLRGINLDHYLSVDEVISGLRDGEVSLFTATKQVIKKEVPVESKIQARQLQGQAASRGIAKGRARVIEDISDFKDFIEGEVLVIDSIDPTMTFFAPLASGIIERRGGMLIHGAIIAREYGIPCITGVRDATNYIKNGDHVTVDGFLGICTIQRL